jgi:hypothetical protein
VDSFLGLDGGVVSVGDLVTFLHPTGEKSGRVMSIRETLHKIEVSVYCVDNTGGYAMSVPHYNIKRKVNSPEEVQKPQRYNKRGKLECWDVILDQEMDFLEGSVLKYLWRYKEKNGIHDLEKAKVYIDKIISEVNKK